MKDFLLSIGVGGDVGLIADLLADGGNHTIDDLMLNEPSLDDLFDLGIVNEADRLAIFYAVHPEEAPDGHNEAGFDEPIAAGGNEFSLPSCFDDEDGLGDEFAGLENDPIAQELAMISAYLSRLEKDRELTDDWLVATDGEQSKTPFDKQAYTRALDSLQAGNTNQFKNIILSIDTNMRDPENNNNTLLHWAVAFKNPQAAQALIDAGARQLMNSDGKTPVELAIDAYESGDSSFFEVRSIVGRHAQDMLKKFGSIGGES